MNLSYFTKVTDGAVKDMHWTLQKAKLDVTFPNAWKYIFFHNIKTVDHFPKHDFTEILHEIEDMQPPKR